MEQMYKHFLIISLSLPLDVKQIKEEPVPVLSTTSSLIP